MNFLLFISSLCLLNNCMNASFNDNNFSNSLKRNTTKDIKTTNVGYLYGELDYNSKSIYNSLQNLCSNDEYLFSTKGYDLVKEGIITQTEVDNYFAGKDNLADSFNKALVAFEYSNPNIFYLDYNNINLELYKNSDGTNVCYVSSDYSTLLLDSYVDKDILTNAKNEYSNLIEDFYNLNKDLDNKTIIKNAYQYIIDNVDYTYLSSDTINYDNSYSALINKKANSIGYSKLFKALLDEFDISSIIECGYIYEGDEIIEHSWNLVRYGSYWYCVDTFLDDVNQSSEKYKYFMVDGSRVFDDHKIDYGYYKDGISFTLPEISMYDLSDYLINDSKFKVTSRKFDLFKYVYDISYNGKGYSQNSQENIYLLVKDIGNNGTDGWFYLDECDGICEDTKEYISYYTYSNQIELAATNLAPFINDDKTLNREFYGDDSNLIENIKIYAKTTYNPTINAPLISDSFPSNRNSLDKSSEYNLELVFNENLVIDESSFINAEIYVDSVKKETIKCSFTINNSDARKIDISFKHDIDLDISNVSFALVFEGIVGEESGKTPLNVNYFISRKKFNAYKLSNKRIYKKIENPIIYESSQIDNSVLLTKENKRLENISNYNKTLVSIKKDKDEIEAKLKTITNFDTSLNIEDCIDTQLFINKNEVVKNLNNKFKIGFPYENDSTKDYVVYYLNEETNSLQELDSFDDSFGLIVASNQLGTFVLCSKNKEESENKKVITIVDKYGVTSLKDILIMKKDDAYSLNISPFSGYVVALILINNKATELSDKDKNILNLSYDSLNSLSYIEIKIVSVDKNTNIKNLNYSFGYRYPNKLDVSLNISSSPTIGDPLTINCSIKGIYNNIDYLWTKDNEIISTNENVVIEQLSISDEGNYYLTVTNYCEHGKEDNVSYIKIYTYKKDNSGFLVAIVILSSIIGLIIFGVIISILLRRKRKDFD